MKNLFKEEMLGSLLHFTQMFFGFRTGRLFKLSHPEGRESHYITISRALTKVFRGETKRLIINVPPRYGKTEMLIHFTAWSLAHYPDANFLYVSYSHSLAKKQTQTIRDIINLSEYQYYFDHMIKDDSSAKDNFELQAGGSVYAAGAQGTITGRGAGIKGTNRFGGAIIIDDIHKPDEVTSDTIREGINEWYYNTLQSRINDANTPIIFIGQRLHEADLASTLLDSGEWESVILPAIDPAGNALHPEMHDLHALQKMQSDSPYNFAAQYQQDPQPSGGGIFKREWFKLYEIEPHMLATFITIDTAETDKTYNDATVFSFWGIHRVTLGVRESDLYGLAWLDCWELRVEPKDLESSFLNFHANAMRHKKQPKIVIIEKKSTGVTLASVLKEYQGIQLIDLERTKATGSKTTRFLEAQPYVAQRLVSLPINGNHTERCLEHMRKITANNSHRFDDICDTLVDAIKYALINKSILPKIGIKRDNDLLAKELMSNTREIDRLKRNAYYS